MSVGALLTSKGQPLVGKVVSFSLGNAVVRAITAADGTAAATLPVNLTPSATAYQVAVAFAEDDAYLTSTASGDLLVVQSTSVLAVQSTGGAVAVDYSDSVVLATLTAGAQGLPLNEEPVIVDLGNGRLLGMLTDGFGRVTISTLDFGGLAPGAYLATIRYAGDARFAPSTTTVAVTVRPENATLAIQETGQPPSAVSLFTLAQQQDGALGDLTRATVGYTLAGTDGSTVQGTLGVRADGAPATTLSLAQGIYRVAESAGGYFVSQTTRATLYLSCVNQGLVNGVGWVPAPDGSHISLGLTAQLNAGDLAPSGNLEVQIPTSGVTFKASALDTLVVCGGQFALRGTGTVNGTPGFRFAVLGSDLSSGDRIEIRIWSASRSESDPDYLVPLQLVQGSITVH